MTVNMRVGEFMTISTKRKVTHITEDLDIIRRTTFQRNVIVYASARPLSRLVHQLHARPGLRLRAAWMELERAYARTPRAWIS